MGGAGGDATEKSLFLEKEEKSLEHLKFTGRESPEMSEATEHTLQQDDQEATKANLQMERRFNGGGNQDTPAEAIDVPEMFRNES
jgi:hypothetical protein